VSESHIALRGLLALVGPPSDGRPIPRGKAQRGQAEARKSTAWPHASHVSVGIEWAAGGADGGGTEDWLTPVESACAGRRLRDRVLTLCARFVPGPMMVSMSLTLHITPSDQIDQLVDRAVSPLDHALGTVECSDPELSPTRIRIVMRMRTRILAGEYVVDADAAAEAIAERLRPAGPVSWLQSRAV
jgi:hypothetical protein